MRRCYDKKFLRYKQYGGRGITVCRQWHRFERFLEDMGDRPKGKTLDRVNSNGDYKPKNCRWSTPKEQANNPTNKVHWLHRKRNEKGQFI